MIDFGDRLNLSLLWSRPVLWQIVVVINLTDWQQSISVMCVLVKFDCACVVKKAGIVRYYESKTCINRLVWVYIHLRYICSCMSIITVSDTWQSMVAKWRRYDEAASSKKYLFTSQNNARQLGKGFRCRQICKWINCICLNYGNVYSVWIWWRNIMRLCNIVKFWLDLFSV